MTVLLDCLLLLSSFILLYTHQQIHTLIQLLFLLFLLFITFFSIHDLYLISFFIGIIYSGGLLITFMFVIIILDINIFNLANKLAFVNLILFFNIQIYNSFT